MSEEQKLDTGHRQLDGGPNSAPTPGWAPAALTASRTKIIGFSGATVAAAALPLVFQQPTPITPKSPVSASTWRGPFEGPPGPRGDEALAVVCRERRR